MFKKLISLFIVFSLLLHSIFAGFLTNRLADFGVGLGALLTDANTVAMFMFITLLFGMFSLFNVLLKFAFKNHALNGENKARKVVAFMMSFIGVTGIYFIFTQGKVNATKAFVLTFGGFFGFLIVLVLSFFVFKLFQNFAEGLTKDNPKGAKIGYWFMMFLALLTVSYLFFGFSGQVLKAHGCDYSYDDIANNTEASLYKTTICTDSTFFGTLMYWLINIIELAITLAIIFGIWFLIARNKKDEEDGDKDGSGNKKSKEKESRIKKVEGALNSVMKSAKNIEKLTKDESDLIKQMGEYTESFEKGSRRVPGEQVQNGGSN